MCGCGGGGGGGAGEFLSRNGGAGLPYYYGDDNYYYSDAFRRARAFNIQRQLALQRNPDRACLARAAGAGAERCPRDRRDPVLVRTQQQWDVRYQPTPLLNPPANLFVVPPQRRRMATPSTRPTGIRSCGDGCRARH